MDSSFPGMCKMMPSHITLSPKIFQKMVFLTNVLEQGWSIKKSGEKYIFTKKHEGRREIFQSDYLEKFIEKNMDMEEVLNQIYK